MLKGRINNVTLFAVGFSVFVMVAGVGLALKSNTPVELAENPTQNVDVPKDDKEPEPVIETPKLDAELLTAEITKITSGTGLEIAIATQNLTSGEKFSYGEQQTFRAASTTKLIALALFMQKVEQGRYSLETLIGDKPASYQLQQLIYYSNNNIWDEMKKMLTLGGLNKFASDLGLSSYNSTTNTITSQDMNLFIAKLYNGEVLSPENTAYVQDLMKGADQNYYFKLAVPEGAVTYSKIGWLSNIFNVTAVVKTADKTIALTVYSKSAGEYNFPSGHRLVNDISQTVINAFPVAQIPAEISAGN